MSKPAPAKPAKLVIGVFMQDKALIDPVSRQLVDQFGPLDLVSHWFAFDYTAYYDKEMGTGLSRRMMAFQALILQDELPDIKQFTNSVEAEFTEAGLRRINIDPGYLLHERFVLATGKNFSHRIYIGKGIYADLTLIYHKGKFQALPWTYPDYTAADMLGFLERARKKYINDFKQSGFTP